MKRNSKAGMSLKALLLAGLLLAQGCAMGGGTIGTGIGNTLQPKDRLNSFALEFSLRGKVAGGNAAALKGARMTAKTSSDENYTAVNADGSFSLPLRIQSGENIVFMLDAGGKKYMCTTTLSPAGEPDLKAEFRLTAGGKLICPE